MPSSRLIALLNTAAVVAGLWLGGGAAGCASKPEIVPSTGPRPATAAEQVKLYQKEPAKYEKLGPVTMQIAANATWDEQGNANQGYERLKAKAATLGANGLLLMADKAVYTHLVSAGYKGTDYHVPFNTETRTVAAEAIYVIEEEK